VADLHARNRVAQKHRAVIEAYAEQAGEIGGDPARDKAAQIEAIDRAGYTRFTRPEAKLAFFRKLWKTDEARMYMLELWGVATEDEEDPVSLSLRLLRTHAVQEDESWGPRSRSESLSAIRQMTQIFVPNQTTKIDQRSVSVRVERPAQFDTEPVMEARSILPEGQNIAKNVTPSGPGDEEDGEDDDG
jgi:hypothetical protein